MTRRFEETCSTGSGDQRLPPREQLDECLEEERASAGREDLGHLLLKKGYITEAQLA